MFEVGKTYKTRDGRDARVICVDREGIRPIIALVRQVDKDEFLMEYRPGGYDNMDGVESSLDLMPPMITKYVNVYMHQSAIMGTYDTPEEARANVNKELAIAIAVPLPYYEGQGK